MMRRCFTLIELLVVIAIIAILASILLPSLNSARERAKRIKCTGNVASAAKAMHMYSDSYQGYLMPAVNGTNNSVFWPNRLMPFVGRYDSSKARETIPKIFVCPSQKPYAEVDNFVGAWTCSGMHYGYNQRIGYGENAEWYEQTVKASAVKRPTEIIAYGDGDGDGKYDCNIYAGYYIIGDFHDKGSPLAYIDGHVQYQRRVDVSVLGAVPGANGSTGMAGAEKRIQMMWGYSRYLYQ